MRFPLVEVLKTASSRLPPTSSKIVSLDSGDSLIFDVIRFIPRADLNQIALFFIHCYLRALLKKVGHGLDRAADKGRNTEC